MAGVVILLSMPESLLGVLLGLVVRMAGSLFGYYCVGIALSYVGNARIVAVGSSCAVLAAACVARLVPAPGFSVSVVLDALLTLACLACTYRAASATLTHIAESPGGALRALASPQSFLPSNHQVFVLMFIFSVAVGFGSTLRIDNFVPRTSGLSIVALVCVLAWFLLMPSRCGHSREDSLFVASDLLIVAGFLVLNFQSKCNASE